MINRRAALWIYGSILILQIYLHTKSLLISCAVCSPSGRRRGEEEEDEKHSLEVGCLVLFCGCVYRTYLDVNSHRNCVRRT
jgi:hypothetical protein